MDKKTVDHLMKIVREGYDRIAPEFDADRQKPIWPPLARFCAEIDDTLKRPKVLDVGCGNGRLYRLFQDRNIDYLGADNCAALIDLATRRHGRHFVTQDILQLNRLPDINFDYALAIALLHHLPGFALRLEAIKQLKSKVRAGGLIMITVWNMWSQIKYRRLILKYWLLKIMKKNNMDFGDILFDWQAADGRRAAQRYYHAFTKRQLSRLAKQADLTIKECYRDKYNYYLLLKKPLNS